MTTATMMNAIIWPDGYVPGFTENFASNEVIVTGLTVEDVWPFLNTPKLWPSYYSNSADSVVHNGKGPELENNDLFFFRTFGFPVECKVVEHVPPAPGQPARIAWYGWVGEEGEEDRLDVHHAWLLEDLPQGRVRILTQETQKGKPAQRLADDPANPMINGHQLWLKGLVKAAREAKAHN